MEIPWELYTAFMENGRPRAKDGQLLEEQPDDELWDAVTQPTAPYTAMNLGMGHGYEHGIPAISMSHHAASKFCEWLSAQTGHYYRLPTEAGMGIRRPRRKFRRLLLRQWRRPAGPVRMVLGQLQRPLPANGNQGTECLGPARHAWKRGGMGSGFLRT